MIHVYHLVIRITPTYMGNTLTMLHMDDEYQDHPHIHGEYSAGMSEKKFTEGSPPHTWGILGGGVLILTICKDHPHIHGEYAHCHGLAILRKGSPPHTWGILAVMRWLSYRIRITPTYMGNTASKQRQSARNKDHPHIHGEYPFL